MFHEILTFTKIKLFGRSIIYSILWIIYELFNPTSLRISGNANNVILNVVDRVDQKEILSNLRIKFLSSESINASTVRDPLNWIRIFSPLKIKNKSVFVFSIKSAWDLLILWRLSKHNRVVLVQHAWIANYNGNCDPTQLYFHIGLRYEMLSWQESIIATLKKYHGSELTFVPQLEPTRSPLLSEISESVYEDLHRVILVLAGPEFKSKNEKLIKFVTKNVGEFYIKPHPSDRRYYENSIKSIHPKHCGKIFCLSENPYRILRKNHFNCELVV